MGACRPLKVAAMTLCFLKIYIGLVILSNYVDGTPQVGAHLSCPWTFQVPYSASTYLKCACLRIFFS
jgi:hypothetical protein